MQVKSEYVGTLTTIELVTRMQSDKHNDMFNVAANLKHVETHENTTEDSWALWIEPQLILFVCCVPA